MEFSCSNSRLVLDVAAVGAAVMLGADIVDTAVLLARALVRKTPPGFSDELAAAAEEAGEDDELGVMVAELVVDGTEEEEDDGGVAEVEGKEGVRVVEDELATDEEVDVLEGTEEVVTADEDDVVNEVDVTNVGVTVVVVVEVVVVVVVATLEVLTAGAPLSWYTRRALICQYASWKAAGLFCTNSLHVWPPFAAEQLWKALPAQLPQNVVSNTRLWSRKCSSQSQPVPAQLAAGVPQPVGSGEEPSTSEGAPPAGQNQMLMPSEFHSAAYVPPPCALNCEPYVFVLDAWKEQPSLPLASASQSSLMACSNESEAPEIAQPGDVCRVM